MKNYCLKTLFVKRSNTTQIYSQSDKYDQNLDKCLEKSLKKYF